MSKKRSNSGSNVFPVVFREVPRVHEAVEDLRPLLVVVYLTLHAEPLVQLRSLVPPPLLLCRRLPETRGRLMTIPPSNASELRRAFLVQSDGFKPGQQTCKCHNLLCRRLHRRRLLRRSLRRRSSLPETRVQLMTIARAPVRLPCATPRLQTRAPNVQVPQPALPQPSPPQPPLPVSSASAPCSAGIHAETRAPRFSTSEFQSTR